jgi:ABC-2 type transport system ATP-binding protein
MLTAHNLTKQYGDYTALNKLNLTIQAGEIFALLGQNGAGKTTTINCFLGFIQPSAGDAIIDGTVVAQNPQKPRSTLLIFPKQLCCILTFRVSKTLLFSPH